MALAQLQPEYNPLNAFTLPNQYSEREIAEAGEDARELAARWATLQRKP
ncbi:MAG TPA: hypothetical protein VHG29_12570 [Novosphingobium sp.]|nr:hypothetical protein [Novosphingobium sp.]